MLNIIKTNETPDDLPQPEPSDESPPVSLQPVEDSSQEPDDADEENLQRMLQQKVENIRSNIIGILTTAPSFQQAIEQNGIDQNHATLRHQRVMPLMNTSPEERVILQYLTELRAKHAEETGTLQSAMETANALTSDEIIELNHRHTEMENGETPDYEYDQHAHPLYRTGDPENEELLERKFWPGTKCRLITKLVKHLEIADDENVQEHETSNIMYTIVRILRKDTKRIIMNRHQFAVFNDTAHQQMPENAFSDLRWPFDDDIYVEFDQPFAEEDEHGSISIEGFMVIGEGDIRTLCFALLENGAFEIRTFDMDISKGEEIPTIYSQTIGEPDHTLPRAICLTMAYMTARGIKIVEEPLPRNVRRQLERKKGINPWHVITTENPSKRYQGSKDPTTGPKHGYRYDVIGHFRFGNHLLSDGSYRTRREWVRPHQRGLNNLNYIPAIRRFNEQNNTPIDDDENLPNTGT